MDARAQRKLLSTSEYSERWQAFQNQPARQNFLAGFKVFYSSIVDGFSLDPQNYWLPIDEHGFHRGDGVFEAIRVVNDRPYLLGPHLDRLARSAAAVGIQSPFSRPEMEQILGEMISLAREGSLILRLYLTRGPGGFGVSPRESKSAQFYAVATRFLSPDAATWRKGVSLGVSAIPVKTGSFARIKSLNYLPNVLMKMEAEKQGVDYVVGLDERGFLTEGATENMVCVKASGELCHPQFERILDGCTMKRLFELAEEQDLIPVLRAVDLTREDLTSAREIFMVGTTLDVTPVTRFENKSLDLGPWAEKLRALIQKDQTSS